MWGRRVTRFSLSGASLRTFAQLRSEREMLQRFGVPDRLLRLEADDLGPAWMGCASRAHNAEARAYAIECGLQARCDAETLGLLQINQALALHQHGDQQGAISRLLQIALDPDATLSNEALAKVSLRGLLRQAALH